MNFDERIQQAFQDSMVKWIAAGEWLKAEWSQRVSIPQADLASIYKGIDKGRVLELVKERIEGRMADAIFNAMATEIATDVKKIMANTELREDLRAILRQHMRDAAKGVEA